jgi:hypothetical protein
VRRKGTLEEDTAMKKEQTVGKNKVNRRRQGRRTTKDEIEQ